MIDQKFTNLMDLVKDFPHLEKYFDDTEELYNAFEKMTTEAGRLLITKKLIENVGNMRNSMVISNSDIEKTLIETSADLKVFFNMQKEILETLANQRIITNTLTNQLVKVCDIIEKAKLSKKSVVKILESSREYLARCETCQVTYTGTMDKLTSMKTCKNCKEFGMEFKSFEIVTRVSY